METVTNFIENLTAGNNYIWLIIALLIIIVFLVGFFADRANKRKKAQQTTSVDNQITNQNISEGINTPLVEPMTELGSAVENTATEKPINMMATEPMIETTLVEEPVNITHATPMIESTPIEESRDSIATIEPVKIEHGAGVNPIEVPAIKNTEVTSIISDEEPIDISMGEPEKEEDIELLF